MTKKRKAPLKVMHVAYDRLALAMERAGLVVETGGEGNHRWLTFRLKNGQPPVVPGQGANRALGDCVVELGYNLLTGTVQDLHVSRDVWERTDQQLVIRVTSKATAAASSAAAEQSTLTTPDEYRDNRQPTTEPL